MSKKKQNHHVTDVTTLVVPLMDDPSWINQMEDYLDKQGHKVSRIMQFLHMKDAEILGLLHTYDGYDNIPKETKHYIADFYEYFTQKYDLVTLSSREEEFGEDCLTLLAGEQFREEFLYEKQKKELAAMDDELIKEAKSLADKLWNIRENRMLSFVLQDAEGNEIPEQLYLEKYIPKEVHEMLRTFILYDCVAMLLSHGSLVVRLTYKNGNTDIFAVFGDYNLTWQPVSAQMMLDAHTLCSDGTRLEPEDGVNYIEITKEP